MKRLLGLLLVLAVSLGPASAALEASAAAPAADGTPL